MRESHSIAHFQNILKFGHFCPNFQTFCPFSTFLCPFLSKIAPIPLLSRIGSAKVTLNRTKLLEDVQEMKLQPVALDFKNLS